MKSDNRDFNAMVRSVEKLALLSRVENRRTSLGKDSSSTCTKRVGDMLYTIDTALDEY